MVITYWPPWTVPYRRSSRRSDLTVNGQVTKYGQSGSPGIGVYPAFIGGPYLFRTAQKNEPSTNRRSTKFDSLYTIASQQTAYTNKVF